MAINTLPSSEASSITSLIQSTAIQQPTINYLRPNAFKFLINRAPNVTYTCQSANLPPISLGAAMQPTSFVDIPHPGDKVQFGEFTIRFLLNEDMSNYIELYNWLVQIGVPSQGEQWNAALNNRIGGVWGPAYSKVFSDAKLLILDSNNLPKVALNFQDIYPINIEALDFDITSGGMEYFQGIASFRYKLYTIEAL